MSSITIFLESNFDVNHNPSFVDHNSEKVVTDPEVYSKCGTGYELVGDRCIPAYP
ncbi:hypothetical protein [Nitrosopumilus sp.]|uniref:hypothetical protein n=1 Tax=Nitrosopumilus sp. TaxID=2024843 RepID=UPI003B5B2977